MIEKPKNKSSIEKAKYNKALRIKCEELRIDVRELKDFYKINKSKKCRKIPDRLDPAVISMEIKNCMDQSLESLAVRLGVLYKFGFSDMLEYLYDRKDKLFFYYAEPGCKHRYRRVKWAPGKNNELYEIFINL